MIRKVAAPTIIPPKFMFSFVFKLTKIRNIIDFTF